MEEEEQEEEEAEEEEEVASSTQRPRQKNHEEILPKSQIKSWSAESSTIISTPPPLEENLNYDGMDTDTDTADTYKNIRIKASIIQHESSGYEYLSPKQRNILLTSIIQPMLDTWSMALKVVPIPSQTPLTIDPYQLYDGKTCGPGMDSGLPSVLVPLDHIIDGVVDTDLMIYVSVGFHDGSGSGGRSRNGGGDNGKKRRMRRKKHSHEDDSRTLDQRPIENDVSMDENRIEEEDMGLRGRDSTNVDDEAGSINTSIGGDMDMVIGTNIDEEESSNSNTPSDGGTNASVPSSSTVPTCSGTYLASATYCSTDQYDRPIAGLLHLCIGPDFFAAAAADSQLDHLELYRRTVMHELGHVLGFNSQSLAHFRNGETGEPLTDRDKNGDVVDKWVQCAGPVEEEEDEEDLDGHEHEHKPGETASTVDHGSYDVGHVQDIDMNDEEGEVVEKGERKRKRGYRDHGDEDQKPPLPSSSTPGNGIDGENLNRRRRRQALMPLPSRDVMRFRNDVRGGVRVAQVVTPTVRQVVRNHFDCQELDGAELESGLYNINVPMDDSYGSDRQSDTDVDRHVGNMSTVVGMDVNVDVNVGEDMTVDDDEDLNINDGDMMNDNSYMIEECISDHWERRLFKADIMNPIMDSVSSSTYISPLTLAYFMDSGWYKVDISRSAEPDIWGRAAGCDFVHENCITEDGLVTSKNSKFFCSDQSKNHQKKSHSSGSSMIDGCSDDMMGKATCSIIEYDNPLPFPYQHFTQDQSSVGGADAYLDYCPTYETVNRGTCTDDHFKVSRMEEVGPNSRCLTGQIDKKKNAALCIPVACVIEDRSLQVRVDELWKPCRYEGEVIESYFDNSDYVFCPNPVQTCPSFHCPRNCLFDGGAGICDYTVGNCACMDEIEGTSCGNAFEFDSLVEMSTSRNYLLDFSGLENDEKDLFDQAARMFIQMNVGEVIGFVTCSLLIVGGCFVLVSSILKIVKDRNVLPRYVSRFWKKDWRVNSRWPVPYIEIGSNSRNKQKMVASVLHNMRVEDAMSECFDAFHDGNIQDDIHHDEEGERVFYRSEMPPLPGVGRVVSVVGARFVNDSIVPMDLDDNMTLAGTAEDTRTSGVYDLNSDHGTEGYVVGEHTMLEEEALQSEPSLPSAFGLTRRRVNIPRSFL